MERFPRSAVRGWGAAAACAFVLARSVTPAAEEPALRLASDVWPPFTNVAGETRLALDLVHEALDRAGVSAATTIVGWKEVTAGLSSGRFDGSAAIWHSAEREKLLLYSEPYLENRLVLVGRKGADVTATDISALAGTSVAVVEQYAYGTGVEGSGGPRWVHGSSDQENLEKLLRGEVDSMLVDELLIRYLVERRPEKVARRLAIGSAPLVRRTLHFAVHRDLPDAASLVERFDREIKKMLADGTYNDVLGLEWIRADVDGDGLAELVPRGERAGEVPPATGYSILASLPRESPVSLDVERYWIGGRVYESWDAVPERYKAPARDPADEPPPALLRF